MSKPTTLQRRSVAVLQIVVVTSVLAASVISLADPRCHERTVELIRDALGVGVAIATIQGLRILGHRETPIWSVVCLVRLLVGTHVRDGIAGAYLYGVALATFDCLFK